MTRSVALLRGINVGKSVRIGMADLRAMFEELGATDVATYLQSGNVVYAGEVRADAVEDAIEKRWGIRPRVLLLDAPALQRVAAANPLLAIATDPSRLFTTFLEAVPASLSRPSPADIAPEVLEIGADAVYQWIPDGVSKSRVPAAFTRSLGPTATARNQRTVEALLALLA